MTGQPTPHPQPHPIGLADGLVHSQFWHYSPARYLQKRNEIAARGAQLDDVVAAMDLVWKSIERNPDAKTARQAWEADGRSTAEIGIDLQRQAGTCGANRFLRDQELEDLRAAGKSSLLPTAGGNLFTVFYREEADLQRALGEAAEAYGWLVKREVVVPWGRIDLVIREPELHPPYLIEVKVDLSKPAQIRKAFQQVDGYSRWWTAEHGVASVPVLTSAKADLAALRLVADVYPTVMYRGIYGVLSGFREWTRDPTLLLGRGAERMLELRRRLEIGEKAWRDLLIENGTRDELARMTGKAQSSASPTADQQDDH